MDESCNALFNANKIGGGDIPPSVRDKSDALPETQKPFMAEYLHSGVSTRSVQLVMLNSSSCTKGITSNFITYAALVCNADYL